MKVCKEGTYCSVPLGSTLREKERQQDSEEEIDLQYNHNIDPVMIYGARVTLQNCSELK
jgi:hypothetical protein